LNNQFLAWKSLRLDKDGWLSSPSMTHDWVPKEPTKAYCGRAHELREIPYNNCGCGIYAVKSTEMTKPYHVDALFGNRDFKTEGTCLVQVAMWGWIHEGSAGYRGQFAYPTAIVYPPYLEQYAKLAGALYEVPTTMVSEEEWQEITGRKPPRPRLFQEVEDQVYSQQEIARAIRQNKKHRLYMQIRNRLKTLEQLRKRLRELPQEIYDLSKEIDQLTKERNAL
jgi:hypothetical protein